MLLKEIAFNSETRGQPTIKTSSVRFWDLRLNVHVSQLYLNFVIWSLTSKEIWQFLFSCKAAFPRAKFLCHISHALQSLLTDFCGIMTHILDRFLFIWTPFWFILVFESTACLKFANCSMFPLAFVAGWLQGHWWGFISRNYVVWPTFLLMNVFIALKGSHFWFL